MLKTANRYKNKLSILLTTLLLTLILGGCGGDSSNKDDVVEVDENVTETTQTASLQSFYFLRTHNPLLTTDIYVEIEGNTLSARVNLDVPVDSLVATFKYEGAKVYVNNEEQQSDFTANDFTNTVTYTVETENGTQKHYDVDLTVFTGLPIINIATENYQPIDSKEDYVQGTVSVRAKDSEHVMTDVEMKIRGRGNSTWFTHPKKPFQMKLEDKAEMMGMPKDKKWLFLAEYSDKTLLRNTIAFELGHISNLDWTPASTFAEVFLNGLYNGTYNITQKVEESDNRVALGDTGYLLEIDQFDRLDADDVYFYSHNFLINIKEPELEFESDEFHYIKNLIRDFETALHSSSFSDANTGYAKYIDIDSFIDWYLISEITKNVDSKFFSSIYLNVMPGEKIKMGPLWDFDLAFGNTDYADSQYYYGFWVKEHTWFKRLFQDPAFVSKVQQRFAYFKDQQEYILNTIDEKANALNYAQQKNDNKWQTIGIYVWPNAVVLDTYQEEVDHMKNWYIDRMDWLDQALNNL